MTRKTTKSTEKYKLLVIMEEESYSICENEAQVCELINRYLDYGYELHDMKVFKVVGDYNLIPTMRLGDMQKL